MDGSFSTTVAVAAGASVAGAAAAAGAAAVPASGAGAGVCVHAASNATIAAIPIIRDVIPCPVCIRPAGARVILPASQDGYSGSHAFHHRQDADACVVQDLP
ncbi:hypothetical protein D3C73_1180890 [compost metagenome]